MCAVGAVGRTGVDVRLLDIPDDARPRLLYLGVAVHGQLAVQHALRLAAGEHVHQRRLHARRGLGARIADMTRLPCQPRPTLDGFKGGRHGIVG